MKQNDFYEVNGCTDFIPVKLIKEHKHINLLEVKVMGSGSRTFAPSIYKFLKVQEQQKVVVPAFIDSFIGYAKAEGMSLFIAMDNAQNKESEWIITHEETFARAWLDGYTIEQEKLYTVEIPNNGGTLVLTCVNQAIKLVDGNKHFPGKFTKESIENAGFYWVWQWAKEVEEKQWQTNM